MPRPTSSDTELTIATASGSLPASLSLPEKRIAGGLVPLHGSHGPSRHHFLLDHLATMLPGQGIAVMRFDRRSTPDGRDVPLVAQAQDAGAAIDALRRHVGAPDLPVGLWGFSQGAWAASLAARRSDTAFLILVSASGVSPAEQMLYGTREQLRRAGYGAGAIRDLEALRTAYERYQRGEIAREAISELVEQAAREPWFALAWVPRQLPPPSHWEDMDFDPVQAVRLVHCPVLAFFGEDDEWVPVEPSIQRWRAAIPDPGSLRIVRLWRTTHYPTVGGRHDVAAISPLYHRYLSGWLAAALTP